MSTGVVVTPTKSILSTAWARGVHADRNTASAHAAPELKPYPRKLMRSLALVLLLAIAACSKKAPSSASAESNKTMQLHPKYPIVEGHYRMTKNWSVNLSSKFNRRLEQSDLVIWRPGFTIWTTVWNNDKSESAEERLNWIKEHASPDAFDSVTETSNGILRYAYRLKESSEDARLPAFYCYAIGKAGHVQMAIYFDSPEDFSNAQAIWRSLTESPEG